MREIDFLPEWYKSGRRRQLGYRTQYLALGGIFVVMIVWNIFAAHSISIARARSVQMIAEQARAEQISAQLTAVRDHLREFQKKAESIERIDSKINVAGVLAEISFLVGNEIVLSKVEFIAEKFADKQDSKTPDTVAVVRAIPTKYSLDKELPIGDVKFKVVIGGVAVDASYVAALICKFEDSPYFCQVVPSFSRNVDFERLSGYSAVPRTDAAARLPDNERDDRKKENKKQISEFEISCYLANYRE